MKKIGILGAGTFGTALARMLTKTGNDVTVWSALPDEVAQLSATRVPKNLPYMTIPDETKFTSRIEEAAAGADIILFAVPSVFMRSTAAALAPYVEEGQVIADVAKGIETDTLFSMTEVIGDALKKSGAKIIPPLVALSGPTHAEEVARDLPTTIVSASTDETAAKLVQETLSNSFMRVYTSTDVKGVELSGAVKNVIALASGISTGLGYGDNTRAALITRGLAEIRRLGVKMGCAEQTFSGLAGVGDLIVTATSEHSRNNRCGKFMGEGMKTDDAIKKVGMVVEGINALPAVHKLAAMYEVEMPISEAVYNVVYNGADPREAVLSLMMREKKPEAE